ncbi:uncharacterized protein A1O5_11006 [Cladophialophora psammophila CBS 110553]|uniref:Heterokaryon incompatibility domain-containing protein n=1 Tax=Cladophialophora psammophila CBS 110553 TaxID=1182543 RepID=W9WL83_9EURO|nr:uncharacterized protein A1O5_11006 [Cladophialophora psammophila CBS 110553]EXJ65765.1 hypothetical protein A1O5_11006 [Cladophialophora psammophila CBS 110553]
MDQVDMNILRGWLNLCESQHGRYCASGFLETVTAKIDFIVVDVQQKKLVNAGNSCRYLALSYAWGNMPQLQLTLGTREELFVPGALQKRWEQIPQVIRDAMHVVTAIGEKYLWVDALCIVQDDPIHKHRQICEMGTIYGGALATIVAAASSSAAEGLCGVHPGTRQVTDYAVSSGIYVAKREPFKDSVLKSTHNTRAWTYQERLLSKRCMYFSRQQVFFQCKQTVWSEDRWEDAWACHTISYNEFASIQHGFGKLTLLNYSMSRDCRHSEIFDDCYALLVQEYSMKNLSYDSDILNGFAGLCSFFLHRWRLKFICGSPLESSLFASALLWYHPHMGIRRRNYDDDSNLFPSWSWSGWIGGIIYLPYISVVLHGPVILRGSEDFVCIMPPGTTTQVGGSLTSNCEAYPTLPIRDQAWLDKEVFSGKLNVLRFWSFTTPLQSFCYEKAKPCPASPSLSSVSGEGTNYRAFVVTKDGWICGGLLGFDADTLENAKSEWEFVLLSASTLGCRPDHDQIVTCPCICPTFCHMHNPRKHAMGDDTEPMKGGNNGDNGDNGEESVKNVTESQREGKEGEPGCMRNVLVLRWEGKYAHRVGIGVIHNVAWVAAEPEMKFIRLS